jgi:hypothetical protein
MVSMSARRTENSGRDRPAPAGELAQVEGVGVAGQAAVPGQEPGEREPLGTGEGRLDDDEGGGRSRGGHQGTSRNSRDLEGWAA